MASWRTGRRSGITSITASTNGNATLAHGLRSGKAPRYATAKLVGDSVNGIDVQAVDAANLTLRVYNASGADVTSSAFDCAWEVRQ